MCDSAYVKGIAAALPIANLDTDQIMPKQFLRGIDKSGLDKGVLWDLRFDGNGHPRPEFVLNRLEYAGTRILIAGPNFGCGSSREHAVWGLLQYGIRAVIAPSFGEIFYSNAMNNRLLAVVLPEPDIQALMGELADSDVPIEIDIDIGKGMVSSMRGSYSFALPERQRMMFLQGLDMIGASLGYSDRIAVFVHQHWASQPWLRDIAARTRQRLSS